MSDARQAVGAIGRVLAGGRDPRQSGRALPIALVCVLACASWLGAGAASGSTGSIDPPSRSEAAGRLLAADILASSNEAGDRHVAPSFTLTYLPGRVPQPSRCLVELPPMTGTSTGIRSTARVMIDGGRAWLLLPSLHVGPGGLELHAGARADAHSVEPEEHVARAEGSVYMAAITPERAAWLGNLYDADTLSVAGSGRSAPGREFDARGFLTAMNAARTLCPNGFPAALVDERPDPASDVGSGVVTRRGVSPAALDGTDDAPSVIDLRGRGLPVDTPAGRIDRARLDAFYQTPRRSRSANVRPWTPHSYSLHAYLSFDNHRWLLLSPHCMCGNAYDPGHSLSLVGLSGPSAGVVVGLNRAYLDSGAVDGMSWQVDDDRLRLTLPGVGTYVHSLSITRHEKPAFEPSPLLTVERRGEAERESLRSAFRERRAHASAVHVALAREGRLEIEGRLESNVWPTRRGERLLSAYTFVPSHPVVVHHESCPGDTTRFASFEVGDDDPALARATDSGRTVALEGALYCHPRTGYSKVLTDVRLVDYPEAVATASPEGAWRCTTTDPTGSRSHDRFVFGRDGWFSATTGDVRVLGSYRQIGDRIDLGFSGVERDGRTIEVDVRTHAILHLRGERTLDFTTIDAASGVERRVVCALEGDAQE